MRGKSVVPVLILVLSLILGSPMLNAASLQVLYTFIGADGGAPDSGVILGPDGALYGVTAFGGDYDNGTVFRLSQAQGGVWSETVLYSFSGLRSPSGGLTFDDEGNLYGTTYYGGYYDCGDIFKLTPDGSSWTFSVIHEFQGWELWDGCHPEANLRYDQGSGLVFGTTVNGGHSLYPGEGTAFSFGKNPVYDYAVYPMQGKNGYEPLGSVNEWGYGTTWAGGKYQVGNIFKLGQAGKQVKMKRLFRPNRLGYNPSGELLTQNLNGARAMYGTGYGGGTGGHGVVYQLRENPNKPDAWSMHVLYSFSGTDGDGPYEGLAMDGAGNLYGTTSMGGTEPAYAGTVFKLTPDQSGKWRQTLLYSFTGGADGTSPRGTLALDSAGNLYGTAISGGVFGWGVVFQIVP